MPRPLRVLFAIGSLAAGGSERQVISILKQIDRKVIEPRLYLLNRCGEFLNDVPEGIDITAFSDKPQSALRYFPGRIRNQQIAHLSETLKTQPVDVLYERTFLMPLITDSACLQTGVPRVSTLDADPRADLRNNVRRFRWIKRRLLTRAHQNAACVVAVSQELGRLSTVFYDLDPSRVRTIYNGFEFDVIDGRAKEPCPECDSSWFNIVSIGRLQESKAVDQLFEAIKPLEGRTFSKPIRVWIVGSGPDLNRLQERVRQLQLQDVVSFVGYQSNPYRWLRNAQLFVLTSRSEGMPSVLVEAMACGAAVISTNCQFGPSEILNQPTLGTLVPVDDTPSLTAAIEAAIVRDDGLQRVRAGRESVESRFSMQSCVNQLTELLLSINSSR